MQDKLFMNAEEVANILGVSKAHAYKLIQRLNGELSAKGFMVIPGKSAAATSVRSSTV